LHAIANGAIAQIRRAIELDDHIRQCVRKDTATIDHAAAAFAHHDAVALAHVNLAIPNGGVGMRGDEDSELGAAGNFAIFNQRLAAGRQEQAAIFRIVNPALANNRARFGILNSKTRSGLAAEVAVLDFNGAAADDYRALTQRAFLSHRHLANESELLHAAIFGMDTEARVEVNLGAVLAEDVKRFVEDDFCTLVVGAAADAERGACLRLPNGLGERTTIALAGRIDHVLGHFHFCCFVHAYGARTVSSFLIRPTPGVSRNRDSASRRSWSLATTPRSVTSRPSTEMEILG